MKRIAAIATAAVLLLLAVMAARYADLFPPLGRAESFHRPSTADFARTRKAFGVEFAGASGRAVLDDLGFVNSASEDFDRTRVFIATSEHCDGRGTYLVRAGGAKTLALFTAPHRGSDRFTGNLAALLYDETSASGAAWNSAPRRQTSERKAFGDLAAEPDH